MDGKRGIRPQGTDGSDFKFRQEIAGKYAAMAQCKEQLGQLRIAQLGIVAIFVLTSVVIPVVSGDFSSSCLLNLVFAGFAAVSGIALVKASEKGVGDKVETNVMTQIAVAVIAIGWVVFGNPVSAPSAASSTSTVNVGIGSLLLLAMIALLGAYVNKQLLKGSSAK